MELRRKCSELYRSCFFCRWRGKWEVERVIKNGKGEVNEVRVLPGWERASAQIDPGAVDAVGPKEIAKARETKETEM